MLLPSRLLLLLLLLPLALLLLPLLALQARQDCRPRSTATATTLLLPFTKVSLAPSETVALCSTCTRAAPPCRWR